MLKEKQPQDLYKEQLLSMSSEISRLMSYEEER